jgi:hypothetical protein
MQKHGCTFIAGAALALAFTFTAQGSSNRTFLSTTGSDSNAATIAR